MRETPSLRPYLGFQEDLCDVSGTTDAAAQVLFLVEIALHGMAFLKVGYKQRCGISKDVAPQALALISAGVLLSEAWDEARLCL